MPWLKRSRVARKTTTRRVRRRTAATVPRRVPRNLPGFRNMTTLTVKRRCFVGSVTPSTAATTSFYCMVNPSLGSAGTLWGTSLSGLSNLAEYQALFDQFRINAVKLELHPTSVDYNFDQLQPSTGTTFYPRGYVSYIIDRRGTTAPAGTYTSTTYNAFTEIGPVKQRRADKKISIYLSKPLITEQFGGGATRYVTPKFADMNASGTAMPHQGIYMFVHQQGFSTASWPTFDVYATYYVTFRGMK